MAMKWYGPQVKQKINKLAAEKIKKACITLRDAARVGLSRTQPTRGTGDMKRGLLPSLPGEFPKKVTGHLRRNVQYEYSRQELKGRVGTNVKYGRWLEIGTRKMKSRPWLRLSIAQTVNAVRRIMEGKA